MPAAPFRVQHAATQGTALQCCNTMLQFMMLYAFFSGDCRSAAPFKTSRMSALSNLSTPQYASALCFRSFRGAAGRASRSKRCNLGTHSCRGLQLQAQPRRDDAARHTKCGSAVSEPDRHPKWRSPLRSSLSLRFRTVVCCMLHLAEPDRHSKEESIPLFAVGRARESMRATSTQERHAQLWKPWELSLFACKSSTAVRQHSGHLR